jgi:aminopeptidase N
MEDVGQTDFSIMADRWLKQTGYPVVSAEAVYNAEKECAEISVSQKIPGGNLPWIFPFTGRLINEEGVVVAKFMEKVDTEKKMFIVPCPGPFAFTIWNPNHAAYLKMDLTSSEDELYLHLRYNSDLVTRFLMHCTLFEREMVKLCRDESAEVSKRLVDEFMNELSNHAEMDSVGALGLTLFESVNDPEFAHSYTKLYHAKQRFMSAVAANNSGILKALLGAYTRSPAKTGLPSELARTFKARSVKNLILRLLATLDTPEIHTLLKERYENAVCSTDRMNAFSLYLSSSAPDRMEMLNRELNRSKDKPVAFENFISAVSGTYSPDTVLYLKAIESSEYFHAEESGKSRSLYLRFAENRKVSLETEAGREFLGSSLLRLAKINEYNTTCMLSVFSHMNSYAEEVRIPLLRILENLRDKVPEADSPAVHRTVCRILELVKS